jgi:DNA-binding NtrC family response regulator
MLKTPLQHTDIMVQPTCMIVEDQTLIAMSLEASLEEAGFQVVGPFITSAEALRWLETGSPGIALLDIMLKEGTSVDVARELKRRGVPFAIYSGLPPKPDCPPEYRDVPWLEKPVSRETLVDVLTQLKDTSDRSVQEASGDA